MKRMLLFGLLLTAAAMQTVAAATPAAAADDNPLVLDETCYWRQFYVTGLMRISTDALKTEGEKWLSDTGLKHLERETRRELQYRSIDWATTDWRDVAVTSMGSNVSLQILPTVYPPADWTKPDFDDSAWKRARLIPPPFHRPPLISPECLNNAIYLRTTFDVPDPAKAKSLALKLVYRGGIRVFLNGEELARGTLPKGSLGENASGDDYPEDAYRAYIDEVDNPNQGRRCIADLRFPFDQAPKPDPRQGVMMANFRHSCLGWLNEKGWNRILKLRDRELGPITIPPAKLRKGRNVLALEIRASHLHPIVLPGAGGERFSAANWTTANDGGNVTWPHASLIGLELRDPSGSLPSATKRPTGLGVWVEDMHTRLYSTDFNQPGAPVGAIRMVGGANGTYGAQLGLSTTQALAGLKATPGDLKSANGAVIPASAFTALYAVGTPLNQLYKLGYGRGVSVSWTVCYDEVRDATRNPLVYLPGSGLYGSEAERILFFDHLSNGPPPQVPADSCQPIWLSLRVPESAAPGKYSGSVKVEADGATPVTVPVELEVFDWRVPGGLDFQTDVMLEQSPYGVARGFNVPLWSDEHFRLIESSLEQLARVGNDEFFIPVLHRTEFGNVELPGMIRWIRKKDGSLAFDYAILDRYLDLVVKHCGKPRIISIVIMHWQMASAPPRLSIFNEATGKDETVDVGWKDGAMDRMALWQTFATALLEHMKAKGLEDSVYWGHAGDHESDPPLIMSFAELFPKVYWTSAPHSWTGASNGGGHNPALFKATSEIYGAVYTPSSRMGWIRRNDEKFLNPRCARELGGISVPYPFRDLADQAIRGGHTGIGRMGFDYYELTWNYGYIGGDWNPPGQPFFTFSWPGQGRVDSGTRFEVILEGVQDAEARIFLEQAIRRNALPAALAKEATAALDRRFTATLLGDSGFYGWQDRTRGVYEVAARAAALVGVDVHRTAMDAEVPALGRAHIILRLRNWTGRPRAWKAQASEKWIVPARLDGVLAGHEDLDITIDGTLLKAGQNVSGTLTVTDSATGARSDVKIAAAVTVPMELLFDHPNFNILPGKTETREFRIANYAATTQPWSLATSVPWMKIAPAAGTLGSESSCFVRVAVNPPDREAAALPAMLTFTGAGGAVKTTTISKTFVIPAYRDPGDLPLGRVLKLEKVDPKMITAHRLTANGDKTLLYYWSIQKGPSSPKFLSSDALIGKKRFTRTLEVLPHHETAFNLEGTDIDAFAAYVGVTVQAARESIRHHDRTVNFEIWVDGKVRVQSGLMTTTDEPRLLVVQGLKAAKEMKIVTRLDSNKDNPNFPVVWANAEFYIRH